MRLDQATWYPLARRVPIPGVQYGSYDTIQWPKGLIHTTEGFTASSAFSAYRSRGPYAPHFTIAPDAIYQHIPANRWASTLANPAGGVQTNRLGVLQAEIVGFCDSRYRDSDLYVHNWSDAYLKRIAEWMLWAEEECGIPRESSVQWLDYPASSGLNAPQRLHGSAWVTYTGWCGHQHADENGHGDPGGLNPASRLFPIMARIAGEPAPPTSNGDDVKIFKLGMTEPQALTVDQWQPIRFDKSAALGPGKLNGKGRWTSNLDKAAPVEHRLARLHVAGMTPDSSVQVRIVGRDKDGEVNWNVIVADLALTRGGDWLSAFAELKQMSPGDSYDWHIKPVGKATKAGARLIGGVWDGKVYA